MNAKAGRVRVLFFCAVSYYNNAKRQEWNSKKTEGESRGIGNEFARKTFHALRLGVQ